MGPLKGYKGNKFEGGHRVPFIVHWGKEIKGNQTFEGLTSSLDIFKTSMSAAGIQTNLELDGTNLIKYAQIANLCDYVLFHNNGGSLFILNKENISNKKNKVIQLSFTNVEKRHYKTMKKCFSYHNLCDYDALDIGKGHNIYKVLN